MNGMVFAVAIPLVISQLYTQPVVYYEVPYYAGSVDPAYGQTYGQAQVFQHALTQQPYAVQSPYMQGSYQQLQYPGLQNGILPGLGLGLYQNTLARELTGGYLNEFRDASGSLNNNGMAFRSQPTTIADHASYMSLINDKDNFQASGCGWDATLVKCTDALGLCKGGCRDFAVSASATLHDCRCIPYGYAALLKLVGK